MAALRFVNVTEQSDKRDNKKFISVENDRSYLARYNTSQKKDLKFLLIELNLPNEFLWRMAAYLDTSNQKDYNLLVSTTNEFLTEFESTWANIPKEFFASGSVNSPLDFVSRIIQHYYINICEIPSELLRGNMLSSHIKGSLFLWLLSWHVVLLLKNVKVKWFSVSLVFV